MREFCDGVVGGLCSVPSENELGKHLAWCISKAEYVVFLGFFARARTVSSKHHLVLFKKVFFQKWWLLLCQMLHFRQIKLLLAVMNGKDHFCPPGSVYKLAN